MIIPKNVRESITPPNQEIEQRREEFKQYVLNHKPDEIIDKYLLFGTPYIFRNDENVYFELQKEIEDYFCVKRGNVHIVGSSKLGFSISPQKRFRDWTIDSDIDIAIVDFNVFMKYWKEFYHYNPKLKVRSEEEDKKFEQFSDYFRRGWLRPDLFPEKRADDLFHFLNKIHGKYKYKVRVGIYADHFFFNEYNKRNIRQLKEEIKNGI